MCQGYEEMNVVNNRNNLGNLWPCECLQVDRPLPLIETLTSRKAIEVPEISKVFKCRVKRTDEINDLLAKRSTLDVLCLISTHVCSTCIYTLFLYLYPYIFS